MCPADEIREGFLQGVTLNRAPKNKNDLHFQNWEMVYTEQREERHSS